jgi:hypothetical protein
MVTEAASHIVCDTEADEVYARLHAVAVVSVIIYCAGIPLLLSWIVGVGFLRTTGRRTPFGGNLQRGMLDPDFQEAFGMLYGAFDFNCCMWEECAAL